jgi:hypothetical protein
VLPQVHDHGDQDVRVFKGLLSDLLADFAHCVKEVLHRLQIAASLICETQDLRKPSARYESLRPFAQLQNACTFLTYNGELKDVVTECGGYALMHRTCVELEPCVTELTTPRRCRISSNVLMSASVTTWDTFVTCNSSFRSFMVRLYTSSLRFACNGRMFVCGRWVAI